MHLDHLALEMRRARGETGAFAMVSGNGRNSYIHNSTFQRSRYNCVKGMIEEAIHEKFDVSTMEDAIRIVDLGCSVGPNTFYTVQTIIDATWATLKKAPRHQAQAYEFQVFFNDQITNDFNTLFGTIPPDRRYFVAGVPGSFYSRLFPRDSVHFFNSTMALHWLSKTPAGVTNKGRVQIYGGGPTILNAHVAQFRADVEAFLRFRAEELVGGGLLAMLFLCRPQGIDLTTSKLEWSVTYLEPILRELVLEGKVKEEELDSFQIPFYTPSIEEFKELVEMNGHYFVHMAHVLEQEGGLNGCGEDESEPDLGQLAQSISTATRAVFEELVSIHFGEKVVEEVFQRVPTKVYQHLATSDPLPPPPPTAFFILQRKSQSSN